MFKYSEFKRIPNPSLFIFLKIYSRHNVGKIVFSLYINFFYRISVFVYFNCCSTVIVNIFNYFCKTLSLALAKYLSANCFRNELKTTVYSTESNTFSLSTTASEDSLLHSIVLSVNWFVDGNFLSNSIRNLAVCVANLPLEFLFTSL